ncbi:hypothetical protein METBISCDRAFT_25018 [Metschnikowia bicuspidata]|uniref:J domain-containing protein n=1 Tax=Metschnikowia bicuspidata TaxID=27322 RepID=A0A4P9Z9H1_9ASCO|nr:hypothetical protein METBISCDRAFT_25018 [Metschnikowia bicuspidata]
MWRRTYATAHNPISHKSSLLHPWPTALKPTPHEIFGISPNDSYRNNAVRAHVRATYKKFVKLYHPDLASGNDVVDNAGRLLLAELKRWRFDAIRLAYDSLCNPQTAAPMPRYRQGFHARPSELKSATHGARYDYAFRKARDLHSSTFHNEAFWQAASWEEFYKMKYNREPPTMEQIEENKWKILKWVGAFVAVYLVLQMMLAMEKANEFKRQTRLMNMLAAGHLSDSYANHGLDLTQLGRIKRFLVQRSLSLPEEVRLADNKDMLIKYAQGAYPAENPNNLPAFSRGLSSNNLSTSSLSANAVSAHDLHTPSATGPNNK